MDAKIHLIYGCFGRKEAFSNNNVITDFVSCPSCENKILAISSDLESYSDLLDYFDSCRLFDRPIFEYNAIIHFLKNIRDRYDQISAGKRIWTETQYQLYQKFATEHRHCGLYIKLSSKDVNKEVIENIEEKGVIIKSNDKLPVFTPKFNRKLIRIKR